nr:MAG TPA_asm: hypothetical protein [Bacteriophage sp.]
MVFPILTLLLSIEYIRQSLLLVNSPELSLALTSAPNNDSEVAFLNLEVSLVETYSCSKFDNNGSPLMSNFNFVSMSFSFSATHFPYLFSNVSEKISAFVLNA